MTLLEMLDRKILTLKQEYKECTNEVLKQKIAYAKNELKILRYEYELENGMIEITK